MAPLPASGPISGSQIASVWQVSATEISIKGVATTASIGGLGSISYSDFYGTGPSSLTAFAMNALNYPKVPLICDQTNFPATRYHDGGGTVPTVGDKIYTTNSTSFPLSDGNYAVRSANGLSVYGAVLDSGDGSVDSIILC
jgi:hypothetical protein